MHFHIWQVRQMALEVEITVIQGFWQKRQRFGRRGILQEGGFRESAF